MSLPLSPDEIWSEIQKHNFAVLGMVTAHAEARTVGIVYVVNDRKLYIGADRTSWKARHIVGNPHVSLTICITRRVPLLPWIAIPAATITFSGTASILEKEELDSDLLRRVYRHEAGPGSWCAIEVVPEKDFVTYGIGVSVLAMRSPERSRARVPVGTHSRT